MTPPKHPDLRQRKKYSKADMASAIVSVKRGTMSARAAAFSYGVPAPTLSRRVKALPNDVPVEEITEDSIEDTKMGRPTALTKKEEERIANYLEKRADAKCGLSSGATPYKQFNQVNENMMVTDKFTAAVLNAFLSSEEVVGGCKITGPVSEVVPTSVPDTILSPKSAKQQPKFQQTTLGQYRTGPQPCPVCSKIITSKQGMENHMRVHTKEKPFSCEICGKCFSQKSTVTTHFISVHSGKKAFKCGICGKRFSLKFYKVSHERSCRRNFAPVQSKDNEDPIDLS